MPLTLEQKRRLIQSHGLNPDEYDVDASEENIIPLPLKAPQPSGDVTTTVNLPQVSSPAPSVLDTARRGATQSLFPTAAGLGATAATLALLPSPDPVTKGGALLTGIAALLAGTAGSIGASKLQEKVVPKDIQDSMFLRPEDMEKNKYTAILSGLAPSLLAFKPSLQDIPELIGGVKALPRVATAGSSALTTPQISALINAGANVLPSAGMYGYDVATGNREFNLGELAAESLPGALLTRPTGIGRMLGFHSPEMPPKVTPERPAIISEKTPEPTSTTPKVEPKAFLPEETLSTLLERQRISQATEEPVPASRVERRKVMEEEKLQKEELANQERRAKALKDADYRRMEAEIEIENQKVLATELEAQRLKAENERRKLDLAVGGKQGFGEEPLSLADRLKQSIESKRLEGPTTKDIVDRYGDNPPDYVIEGLQRDWDKAVAKGQSDEQLRKVEGLRKTIEELKKLKASYPSPEIIPGESRTAKIPASPKDVTLDTRNSAEEPTTDFMQPLPKKEEVKFKNKLNEGKGYYSKESDLPPLDRTPIESLPAESRSKIKKEIERVARLRGQRVSYVDSLKDPATGKEILGQYDPKTKSFKLNKALYAGDTGPHETAHGRILDMLESTSEKDSGLILRGLEFSDPKGRKFKTVEDYKKLPISEQLAIEERFTKSVGPEGYRRQRQELFGRKRERFTEWVKQIGNHLKVKSGAEDSDALFQHFIERQMFDAPDAARAEMSGVTPAVKMGDVEKAEKKTVDDIAFKKRKSEESDLPEKDAGDYFTVSSKILKNKNILGLDYNTLHSVEQLKGTLFNKIPPIEQQLLKDAGIDNLKGKMSPKDLERWIKENGPKVEIKDYGMDEEVSKAKEEFDRMTHEWYDNLPVRARRLIDSYNYHGTSELYSTISDEFPSIDLNKLETYEKLANKAASEPHTNSLKATQYYNQVSVLDTKQPMPEWTNTKAKNNVQRVDVVIPQKEVVKMLDSKDAYTGEQHKMTSVEPRLWEQDDLHENLPNTLGWAMIQYKDGPKGEKVAVIAEAQSRWGQEMRARNKTLDELGGRGPLPLTQDHPLLKDYNRLILKAAIAQAKKEGATHIMLSDAETAMMTEGHDSSAIPPMASTDEIGKYAVYRYDTRISRKIFNTKEAAQRDADAWNDWYQNSKKEIKPKLITEADTKPDIEQEGGMRLNYDKVLPSIAEDLLGTKGERISLGEHKNAFGNKPTGKPREGLIFKNKDGSPKIDISGILYPIDKAPSDFSLTAKRFSTESDLPKEEGKIKSNRIEAKNINSIKDLYEVLKASKPIHTIDSYRDVEKITGRKIEQTNEDGDWSYTKSMQEALEEHFPSPEYRIESHGGTTYVYNDEAAFNSLKNPKDIRNSESSDLPSTEDSNPEATLPRRIFSSATQAVRNLGGETADHVASQSEKYFAKKSLYEGKYSNTIQAEIASYPKSVRDTVDQYGREMHNRGESDVTLSPEEQSLYDSVRDYLVQVADENTAREIKKNPNYWPAILDSRVASVWSKAPNSIEGKYFQREWMNHAQEQVEKGRADYTHEELKKILDDYMAAVSSSGRESSLEFGALRKAAGLGLPITMQDNNLLSRFGRYGKRVAKDMAFRESVESDPTMRYMLRIKDDEGVTLTEPPALPNGNQADSKIRGTEQLNNIQKFMYEEFQNNSNPRLQAFSRLVNSALLGTATGIRDFVTSPLNISTVIGPRNSAALVEGLKYIKEGVKDSFNYGARKIKMNELEFGSAAHPDTLTKWFNEVADGFRKYSGRESLEQGSRIYMWGVAKAATLAEFGRASNGHETSLNWLKKYGNTVDNLSEYIGKTGADIPEDVINRIAKNVVDRAAGTYDARGLPAGVMEGPFAPFFSLSRWSIEKANTIVEDVLIPARKGNFAPLLTYGLGSFLTGSAIQELNKLMSSGKEGVEPTLKEASVANEQQVRAVVNLLQLGSFGGIIGDLMKSSTEAYAGHLPRGLSFPLADFVSETLGQNLADYFAALQSGEDKIEASLGLTERVLTSSIQSLRLLSYATWNKDEVDRKNAYRDYRLWQELSGRKSPESTIQRPNEFLNKREKEFKRAKTGEDIEATFPKAIESVIEKAGGNPLELIDGFKRLKANSYQTWPTEPVEQVAYYEYLKQVQGEEKAAQSFMDFMQQRELNKIKNRMIPNLMGKAE